MFKIIKGFKNNNNWKVGHVVKIRGGEYEDKGEIKKREFAEKLLRGGFIIPTDLPEGSYYPDPKILQVSDLPEYQESDIDETESYEDVQGPVTPVEPEDDVIDTAIPDTEENFDVEPVVDDTVDESNVADEDGAVADSTVTE